MKIVKKKKKRIPLSIRRNKSTLTLLSAVTELEKSFLTNAQPTIKRRARCPFFAHAARIAQCIFLLCTAMEETQAIGVHTLFLLFIRSFLSRSAGYYPCSARRLVWNFGRNDVAGRKIAFEERTEGEHGGKKKINHYPRESC